MLDVRPRAEKERLFAYKEQVWSGFGYSHAYLEQMKSPSFWDAQFDAIPRSIVRCLTGAVSPRSK